MAGYAGGQILTAGAISVLPGDVFAADRARPRLDLLAAALLKRRPEEKEGKDTAWFWRALRSGLAAPRPWETEPEGAHALERLRVLVRRAQRTAPAPMGEPVVEALERVRDVAEGGAERFAARYTSPADLGEDVLLCRCLERGIEGAQGLAELRRYLIEAAPPDGASELAADRIMTLEQLSFATLLEEPKRLAGMRSTFQVFREAYRKAYLEQHRRYGEGAARLHALLEEAEPVARALARLNTLRALGPAVGRTALSQYQRLLADTTVCARGKELEGELLERPLCSRCGLRLADSPPEEAAREAVRGLRRALARQHARLASEAMRQILARRGGERIERFLQIVQASDLSGLVNVLDDTLLDFLGELLAPAAASTDVLGELAQLFPSVGEANLDAAVEEFRRLLKTALDTQHQAAPRRAPRVRLQPPEAPPR
jgi:hypothetical protein